jgi:hypothetical protein
MPFGLTNAPATFQNYIHQALGGLLDEFCVAYLDDILIFSADRESHTKHVRQVLERLRAAQLYCKPANANFTGTTSLFSVTSSIGMDSPWIQHESRLSPNGQNLEPSETFKSSLDSATFIDDTL